MTILCGRIDIDNSLIFSYLIQECEAYGFGICMRVTDEFEIFLVDETWEMACSFWRDVYLIRCATSWIYVDTGLSDRNVSGYLLT